MLPSWRGGDSPNCCYRSLFASGLCRLSLHTSAIPEGEKNPTNKNIIWLSFGKNVWGKHLQDLTFIPAKKSLRNRNLPFFLCVIFLRGQSPTKGEIQKVRISKTSEKETWLN